MVKTRKKPEIPTDLVGIAGVHYVAFELSRRKMIVLPTTRNTKGYDIVVLSPDGTRHAIIQVKSAQKRPNFWPMPKSDKVQSGSNDYCVLVRGIGKHGATNIECFLVSGREALGKVTKVEEGLRKRHKAPFPCIYMGGKYAEAGAAERWSKDWQTWTL